MVVQLSAQLYEAQEQMVCAAVSQPPSPQRVQVARTLEVCCVPWQRARVRIQLASVCPLLASAPPAVPLSIHFTAAVVCCCQLSQPLEGALADIKRP